ncbi:thioredoxin-like protein [Lasiosphaeris hirsuta]|uniref:Monothiol glutaredoxin-5, mitochondrial n=1 Tax=Lasiosphaeris hirsuta TaxID=260670 RepID=A0AA40ARK1_9PEZI|nr:thioredoxin-like protein [Lasiosphaeris hirsuta]
MLSRSILSRVRLSCNPSPPKRSASQLTSRKQRLLRQSATALPTTAASFSTAALRPATATSTFSSSSSGAHPLLRSRTAPPSLLLRRLLSDQTRQAIDKAVGSAPVVLFMKGTPETPQCGFSRASIQILGLQGVDPDKFAAFNVLEDAELRQGIKEYSDWPTIPQLYIDKEFVGGCDIIVSMHQNGELAKLLDEKKVLVKGEEAEGEAAEANKE